MKKLSSKIIISLLLATFLWGGAGQNIIKLYAQTLSPGTLSGAAQVPTYGPTTVTIPTSPNTTNIINPADVGSAATERALAAAQKRSEEEKEERWYSGILRGIQDGFTKLASGAANTVMGIIAVLHQLIVVPILGVFVKIVTACLDMSVKFTLDSTNISNADGAISMTWSMVRNIFNVTFIFILLYVAIKTIIGSASANTKKTIANVVVAALLINFSLFITRVLVDAGNILATTLYNSATTGGSMSSVLAKALGLGKLFATTGVDCTACSAFFIVTAIQEIVMITTIIVLSYVALLMFTRSIILIFLMVLSPIGFMGDVLPKLSEYSKMWRENLYGQISIAPIFLLFFYLIIKVSSTLTLTEIAISSESMGTASSTAAINEAITATNKNFTIFFRYILILILLIVAVKITKKMSGVVGSAVEKFGMAAIGVVVGAATGGAALLARQTIGRGAANTLAGAEGAALRAKANDGDLGARRKLASLEFRANSSFDVRNTKVAGMAGRAFSNVGGRLGVQIPNTGKPGSWSSLGGFANTGLDKTVMASREEREKKEMQEYNRINSSVTNRQRLDANEAVRIRDGEVRNRLANDQRYSGQDGVKTRRDALVDVNQQYLPGTREGDELARLRDNITAARNEHLRLQNSGGDPKDIAAAKRVIDAEERTLKSRERELQDELKKKYAGEIAELDDQIKRIKTETEISVENDRNIITEENKAKLDIVNQARNYSSSIRSGRLGHNSVASLTRSGRERNARLADRMENQRS